MVVEVSAANKTGMGYAYADSATAKLINELLAKVVEGRDAMAIPANWLAMARSIRNLGRPGISSMAISAVDNALWDLKARVLGVPLVTLLGAARERIPIYGSGGFTSYDEDRLCKQLSGSGRSRVLLLRKNGRSGREPQRCFQSCGSRKSGSDQILNCFIDADRCICRKSRRWGMVKPVRD